MASIPQQKSNETQYKNPKATSVSTNTYFEEKTATSILSFPEKEFRSFTGLSRKLFEYLLFKTNDDQTDSRVLSKAGKLALFFVKLKLNVSYMFLVSRVLARTTFLTLLDILSIRMKDYIIWFNKTTVKKRLPSSFQGLYPETRCIIDASEIECERPKTVRQLVLYYSSYKSRFTVKFLVGCAPSGAIVFISKGFGGRTTDTEITTKSGFLNLIEPGDMVMADKGFPHIQSGLADQGGILVMPPFRSSKHQFTQDQVNNL